MESESLATSVPPADVEPAGGDELAAGDHIDMGTKSDICMNVYDDLLLPHGAVPPAADMDMESMKTAAADLASVFVAPASADLAAGHAWLPRDRSSPDAGASPPIAARATLLESVARCQSSHGPRRWP